MEPGEAVHTAGIVTNGRSLTPQIVDGIREINMGLWEGKEISFIQHKYATGFAQFFEAPHLYTPAGDGETYPELLDRSVSAMEDILSKHQGESLLIVTHRITLKALLNYYAGRSLSELGNHPDVPPASLSRIVRENGKTTVELYGDISHYEA
ncbi:histidine phosphatase family protein [Paenibacillus filicis]|uniref:Histidine phosphatase family protein n=1 Tax=Paenibacillus filicis TaxID=669464 RepID=A0ABU9DS07_9BACL